MSLKKVIYEQKSTNKWVAEINDFETPVNTRIAVVKKQIWQDVFDSKEEAEEAAERELDKRTGILKRRYAHAGV